MKITSRKAVLAAVAIGILAVGARADTVFVSNYNDGAITRITSDGLKSTFATVIRAPYGLAFDRAGNLLVAQAQFTNKISVVTPVGAVSVFRALATGYDATALAYGPDGALYVASQGGYNIRKAGATSAFASGFSLPLGMAFDQDGNLYVGDQATARISKISRTGTATIFATGMSGIWGLAFDSTGNLYAAASSLVYKIKPDGTKSTFALGFNSPAGIAFNSSGDLFVVDSLLNSVKRVSPDGVVHSFVAGLNQPLYIAIAPDTSAPQLNMEAAGTVKLLGGLDQWYVFSWSTDFTSWTPFRTNQVVASAALTEIDASTGTGQIRFYRAQTRP